MTEAASGATSGSTTTLQLQGHTLETLRRGLLSTQSAGLDRAPSRRGAALLCVSGDGEGGEAVDADAEDLNARIFAIALPALGALAIDPLLGVVSPACPSLHPSPCAADRPAPPAPTPR